MRFSLGVFFIKNILYDVTPFLEKIHGLLGFIYVVNVFLSSICIRFKLPQGLCKHINSVLRKFWWGSKDGKRKMCWVSWEEMCKPKFLGGLGFRDIELFNLALLARQGWRILQNPQTLSARILKAIYFP
jgi:hypothetical protein